MSNNAWLNDNILKYEGLWLLYMCTKGIICSCLLLIDSSHISQTIIIQLYISTISYCSPLLFIYLCVCHENTTIIRFCIVFVMLISYIFARHKYWMNDWMNWPWMRKSTFPTWIIVHHPAWGNHTLGIQSYSHLNMVYKGM